MVPISAQAKDLSRRPTAQELHRTRDQTHREILPRQNASANCTYRYKGRTGHTDIRARGIIIIRTYVRYVAVVCPRVLLGVETRMFWWTADDVLARSGMSECKVRGFPFESLSQRPLSSDTAVVIPGTRFHYQVTAVVQSSTRYNSPFAMLVLLLLCTYITLESRPVISFFLFSRRRTVANSSTDI